MSAFKAYVSRDRGSMSVEALIVVPALMLVCGLLIAWGRLELANQNIAAVADASARAASLARTADTAIVNARTIARSSALTNDLTCITQSVSVNSRGYAAPLGQPATVSVTVTCTVSLSDIALPGLPGQRTLTATSSSPLDTYRQRS